MAVLASVRIWLFAAGCVGFLTGCGGGGAASTDVTPVSSGSLASAPVATSTPSPTFTRLQGHVLLDAPVTNAKVHVVLSDGTVWGSGATNIAGGYDVTKSDGGTTPIASDATGLKSDEYRVIAILTDGTRLMADGTFEKRFLHVTVPSTLKSMLRINLPGVTLEQAESDIKAYLKIPQKVNLENVGGPHSAFSAEEFLRRANASDGVNGFLAFINAQVQTHRSKQAGAGTTSTNSFATVDSTATAVGVDQQNQDSDGTSDPDYAHGLSLQTADGGSISTKITDTWPGTANSILEHISGSVVNVNQTFQQIYDIVSDGGSYPKLKTFCTVMAYATMAVSILSFIGEMIADGSAEGYTSEIQQAVNILSAKIDELESKMTAAKIEITYTVKKATVSNAYTSVTTELDKAQALSPSTTTTAGKTTSFQTITDTQQTQITTLAQSQTGSTGMRTIADAITADDGLIRDFNALYQSMYGLTTKDTDKKFANYPLRTNTITLSLRSFLMNYVHQLEMAMNLDGTDAQASYVLKAPPSSTLQNCSSRMQGSTFTFGGNGVAALRRQALLVAPPRFPSDKVVADSRNKLIWSQEVLVKVWSDVRDYGMVNHVYGDRFKHDDYELSADFLPKGCGWRIPTKAELQALPGFGSTMSHLEDLGFPTGLPHYMVYYDSSLESSYIDSSIWSNILVYGKVKFLDFTTGADVSVHDITSDKSVASLRVVSLPGIGSTATTYAWPDLATRKPSWWPDQAYESNVMVSAGITPDAIVVIDNKISHPLYDSARPYLHPKTQRVLSAIAYWKMDKSADGKTRGIVADVSGRVVWKSSEASVATVRNTLHSCEEGSKTAATSGLFVSKFAAPITFSKADTEVEFSASWTSALGDSTLDASSKLKIKQAADADLQVPAITKGITVSPASLVWTRFTDADGAQFSATASRSDYSVKDLTSTVTWSVYTVQVDGTGAETGTTPLDASIGNISQGGVNTVGGILHLTEAAKKLGPTRIRIQATDPATGFTEKADMLLQFNNT